jgi:hypothetical protein
MVGSCRAASIGEIEAAGTAANRQNGDEPNFVPRWIESARR